MDPVVTPATAYGTHLLLTLRAAIGAGPHLFHEHELALAAALASLPAPAANLVSRLTQRRTDAVDEARLAADPAALAQACASCWVIAGDGRVGAAPAARELLRVALLVAFADDREDLSIFPRLGLERLALPERCPLAAALRALAWRGAGLASPDQGAPAPTAAFADRAAVDAYLHARAARAAGPGAAAMAEALAAVEASAGTALPLAAHQLAPLHHWTSLLWECREQLAPEDPRRARCLRALRRAPLGPGLARLLWTEVHRGASHRAGRVIARDLASFAIWRDGDRGRWRLRAATRSGVRRREAPRWRTTRVAAWLDHEAGGAVVAEGEGVEAHALRRLADQGWRGLHAEGGFWLALACLLFHDEIFLATASTAAAWRAPLQAMPLDWGRWGFAARRARELDARAAALARDPFGEAERALARLEGRLLPGLVPPPRREHALEVCRRMPPLALARMLARIIGHPGEAGGLPDLVVWRGDELALWEVKSPGDQLSDRQRAWLAWLDHEGLACGVLRVDAREPTQQRLASVPSTSAMVPGSSPVAAAPRPQRPASAPRPAGSAAVRVTGACRLLACAGASVPLLAGAALPCSGWPAPALPLAADPLLPVARWSGGLGAAQVSGWDRPVRAVVAIMAHSLLAERREGRRVAERRWFPVPDGFLLAAVVADEADDVGGVRPVAALLTRASGWLLPAAFAPREPVAVTREQIAAVMAGVRADWLPHPQAEPLRPERQASTWGYGEDLAGQLALIGAEPYQLSLGHEPMTIDLVLDDRLGCLWTVSDPRLRRAALEIDAVGSAPMGAARPGALA